MMPHLKKQIIVVTVITFILAAGVAHADGDARRGEKLFEDCRACHALERGVESLGPDLHAVLGRRAGALDNFRYSPALRRSGITWTPQTLDAYVADPQKLVPANRMPYSGMPDARDRADLIVYMLEAFK
jgi:cytochrome c2